RTSTCALRGSAYALRTSAWALSSPAYSLSTPLAHLDPYPQKLLSSTSKPTNKNTLLQKTPILFFEKRKRGICRNKCLFSQRGWEKCSRSNKGVYVCYVNYFTLLIYHRIIIFATERLFNSQF